MGFFNRLRRPNRPVNSNVVDIRKPLRAIPKGIYVGVQNYPLVNGNTTSSQRCLFAALVNHRPTDRGLKGESWKVKIYFDLDSSNPIQHIEGHTRRISEFTKTINSEFTEAINKDDFEWIFNAIAKQLTDLKAHTGLPKEVRDSLALDIASLGQNPDMTILYIDPATKPALRLVGD